MKILTFVLVLGFFLTFSGIKAQNATFTFKTVTENGTYSPKHVLAVWVETSTGNYIRTLKLRGSQRKQYLYTWNSKSGGSSTDANTGSTLSSHQSHTVNWNLKDLNGNLLPDGDYKIVVEYTDKHAQGPMFTLTFTKNSTASSQTPANQSYFTNMSFSYDPNATVVNEYSAEDLLIQTFPNPAHNKINLVMNQNILQSGNLQIMDAGGKIVLERKITNSEMNNTISLDLSTQPAGVYFIIFKADGQIVRQKLLVY